MFDPKNRRQYTKEFKQDTLNLSISPGYTVSIAAKNLGISERQIYRWRKELETKGSEWRQKNLCIGMSVKEISNAADEYCSSSNNIPL